MEIDNTNIVDFALWKYRTRSGQSVLSVREGLEGFNYPGLRGFQKAGICRNKYLIDQWDNTDS